MSFECCCWMCEVPSDSSLIHRVRRVNDRLFADEHELTVRDIIWVLVQSKRERMNHCWRLDSGQLPILVLVTAATGRMVGTCPNHSPASS